MGNASACLTQGGYLIGLIFAGYVLLTSQNPYPIIVYISVANIIIDPILVTLGKMCNFCDPNFIVTFF